MTDGQSRGYLAAQAGAVVGALAAVAGSAVMFQLFVLDTIFEDGGRFERWAVLSALGCIAGASLGCAIVLRRRRHAAPLLTAVILLAGLLVLFAVVLWSSSTALQSRLYPYAFAVALVSPVCSRVAAVRLRGDRQEP